MATILAPDGSRTQLIGTSHHKALSLDQMQKAVDGLIEPIYNEDHSKVICIGNEEGLFRTDLPTNEPARQLIAEAFGVPVCCIQDIRGNVIIPDRDNGNDWY